MMTKLMHKHRNGEFEKEFNKITPSAEADICLNCPLPSCKKNVCKRFNEEKRKLKKGEETRRAAESEHDNI